MSAALRIGVLAEDETDCDTLDVLIRRIARDVTPGPIGISKHWGKGCARLRTMAAVRMSEMARKGCAAVILVHDLDRNPRTNVLNDEAALFKQLDQIEVPGGLMRLICIPVEELEAWFWSDPKIIEDVGRGKGKADPSPHLIAKPKEKLQRLSAGANRKPRYSTNDNATLAAKLDLELCAKRCPAFQRVRAFVRSLLAPSAKAPTH